MFYGKSEPDASGPSDTLTVDQVAAIDRVTTSGQVVLDTIKLLQEQSVSLLGAIASSIEPGERNGCIALLRVTEGLGLEVDAEEETVATVSMTDMLIAVEEAVMWARKALTK